MRTQTKTKTKGITGTKLAVATLVALAAGGAAFAVLPSLNLKPIAAVNPAVGRAPTITTSTIAVVRSCTIQPQSTISVILTDGTKKTYQNGCVVGPNGEKNFIEYSCLGPTPKMIANKYEFCCKDWDAGNPAIKGVVSTFGRAINGEDYCTNANKLQEATCDDARNIPMYKEVLVGPNLHCENGRIIAGPAPLPVLPANNPSSTPPQAATCTDSDGGLNLTTRGTVTLGNETHTDYCSSVTELVEYQCENNAIISSTNRGTICSGGVLTVQRAVVVGPTSTPPLRVTASLALTSPLAGRCTIGVNNTLARFQFFVGNENAAENLRRIRINTIRLQLYSMFSTALTPNFTLHTYSNESGRNIDNATSYGTQMVTLSANGTSGIVEIPINLELQNTQVRDIIINGDTSDLIQAIAGPGTSALGVNLVTYTYTDLTTGALITAVNDVPIRGGICSFEGSPQAPTSTPPTANVTLASGPASQIYLMGAVDQWVASYQITAGNTENIIINTLALNGLFSGQASTVQDVRLFDDQNVQIGQAVAFAPIQGQGANYAHAVFSNLNLRVPKGVTKTIKVKVDFGTYENAGLPTGQTFIPFISSDNSSVGIVGVTTGIVGSVTIPSNANGNQMRGLYGSTATLYRAKIMVAWAGDTPTGLSSPNSTQTIGKFVVTNLANPGGYSATIKTLNVNLNSSITNSTSTSHELRIYKDNLGGSPVATYTFAAGQPFANIQISDANFTDVQISAGASKTFYITLDTSDARANNTLSVHLGANQSFWSDGDTSGIAYPEQLDAKTLQY